MKNVASCVSTPVTNAERESTSSAIEERWSGLQILVVGLCFIVNMIDGMDVLVLSYIAPTLQLDWGVSADRIGVLFSAGIVGMAIGGLALAPLADVFGRRLVVILALTTSTSGMLMSGLVTDIWQLMILRVIVGMGIGSVLASMAALVSEYAPDRHRNFAVGLLYAGYPLGAIATGLIAVHTIPAYGWKATLVGAGMVSALMLPLLYFFLPESMQYLIKRRPPRALERLNDIRQRIHRSSLTQLPAAVDSPTATGVRGLFTDGRARSTMLLWSSMILGFASLWFAISWIPKLATMSGLDASSAIYAGTSFNAGAFFGTVALGLITARLKLQPVIAVFLASAALAMIVFGNSTVGAPALIAMAFVIGFLLQGGFNGIYPLGTRLYPAEVRSTGIGWTMGVGRIGAVLGPLLGGVLISRDVPVSIIFLVFAVPAVVGGLCAALVVTDQGERASGHE
jgi:benzoate transport